MLQRATSSEAFSLPLNLPLFVTTSQVHKFHIVRWNGKRILNAEGLIALEVGVTAVSSYYHGTCLESPRRTADRIIRVSNRKFREHLIKVYSVPRAQLGALLTAKPLIPKPTTCSTFTENVERNCHSPAPGRSCYNTGKLIVLLLWSGSWFVSGKLRSAWLWVMQF
jgi:hypothetical protein